METEPRLIDVNVVLRDDVWACKGYQPHDRYYWGCLDTLVAVEEVIKNAPTVDAVEVVHAKWENVQNGKGCCSNCNRLDSIDNLATHCRYCGAKMDLEDT